ncbi:aspartyl-phosphate phosphatase Spo0E family protein [Cytobacillus purgationiresistens]|uniref:Spo0E like sporulation regulatory protein n=1 Tax=Cytobacillus purgationiresistens TaxID=863449 RepID=A0ABU0ACW4_9BACI|nr:aspartyl-phosphate phosphatase Spo0E family protein [Cytobacillus purgationiresistens]MDQ0268642.1 hypothetical protein [Cytobacillus purgationiresistens]
MKNIDCNIIKLIEQINELRLEMINVSKSTGINSLNTLKCSQKLDKLIYSYQSMNKK